MSSTLSSSPFASALPQLNTFFQYDADGDCIMTDALTGLPITYGERCAMKRRSSVSSEESRPSKRSRTSSDEGDNASSPSTSSSGLSIRTPRAPVGIPSDVCPPAPKKALTLSSHLAEGGESVLRNLAESMAESVLASQPPSPITHTFSGIRIYNGIPDYMGLRDDDDEEEAAASFIGAGAGPGYGAISPIVVSVLPREGYTASGAVMTTTSADSYFSSAPDAVVTTTTSADSYVAAAGIPEGYGERGVFIDRDTDIVGLTIRRLGEGLTIRHPRHLLLLIDFVATYNDFAPEGEKIDFPPIKGYDVAAVLNHPWVNHPWVKYPRADHMEDITNLKAALAMYACDCRPCSRHEAMDMNVEDTDWSICIHCKDLSLRLDMRHPLLILYFLRFVHSYNILALRGESIKIPNIPCSIRKMVFAHPFVTNPPAEFKSEITELNEYMYEHTCQCPDCNTDNWSDSHHEDESEDEREDDRDDCGCERCNPDAYNDDEDDYDDREDEDEQSSPYSYGSSDSYASSE